MRKYIALVFLIALSLTCGRPASATQQLTVTEVKQILAQAIQEAQARGTPAAIAVVDRVGNVLALYEMASNNSTNANGLRSVVITSDPGQPTGVLGKGGLETLSVPARGAALSKAITGAYLSSNGNAFTSRTASQIVQEHFNPKERFAPSGPLFGVQISQLPCSDLMSATNTVTIGPKRSPLGLAADPGGLPLYKSNELVGGIGVIADGTYSFDTNIRDYDSDNDELIAIAGAVGFEPPTGILGSRITVEGKTLRYTDQSSSSLASNPAVATAFDQITSTVGALVSLSTYFDGTIQAGTAFGEAASGYRADTTGQYGRTNAFILVDQTDSPRYAPKAGTEGTTTALTANEVTVIIKQALNVAFSARAQIRRPLGDYANVTISVVDTNGAVLGIARSPDGPVFGTDVSLQKARTAAFFSSTIAADELTTAGQSSYVTAVRAFVGSSALSDGTAFADRSGGNLSRPYYPDGIVGKPNGPFSKPIASWSPFNTGLQLDLVTSNLVSHLEFLTQSDYNGDGVINADTDANCTALSVTSSTSASRLANGIQIFPGSVPIYRNGTLIGGIGVSGDGIDQDDMISFLGLHNGGLELGTGVGNAPAAIRADNLTPQGARLRYVNCPYKPFLNANTQNVCAGK